MRTLKIKIYKYMTAMSKNTYIDKLSKLMEKYNNTIHRPIKTRQEMLKPNAYINLYVKFNTKKSVKLNGKDKTIQLIVP